MSPNIIDSQNLTVLGTYCCVNRRLFNFVIIAEVMKSTNLVVSIFVIFKFTMLRIVSNIVKSRNVLFN